MAQVVLKVLGGILMKLLAEKALEDLIIFGMEKLAQSTNSKVDDDLVAIVKKAIKGEQKPE